MLNFVKVSLLNEKNINANIKKWHHKVSYGLLDQIFFSGANFVVNLALVHWNTIDQYGSFALAFMLYLIASSFFNALVFEPMSVLGLSHYHKQEIYINTVLLIFLILSFVFSLLFIILHLAIGYIRPEIEVPFTGLSFFTPLMLIIWLFRQYFHMIETPVVAFKGSFLYFFIIIIGLVLLRLLDAVSAFSGLGLMGAASVISTFLFWPKLSHYLFRIRKTFDTFEDVWRRQWSYGKWVVCTALFYSFNTLSYPIIVGFYLGLSDVGILRATQNLILPLQQIIAAFSLIFLPFLLNQRMYASKISLYKSFILVFSAYLFITFFYSLLLFFSKSWIIKNVLNYELIEYEWIIFLWIIYMIIHTLIGFFNISIRAFEKPKAVFVSNVISSVFIFSFGIFAVIKWTLYGVMITMIISSLLTLVIVILYFVSYFRVETGKPVNLKEKGLLNR